MDAIKMLEEQHHEAGLLFAEIEATEDRAARRRRFDELADALAVHVMIEERHFYPAVRERRTDDILLEALEEHLAIKRVLADLLDLPPGDETFDAKLALLEELVEHHVAEEESDLFPKARRVLPRDVNEAVARRMAAMASELESRGRPRDLIRRQTDEAAHLPTA